MDASDRHNVRCPRCRYNLRGLPTPRCPECGLTFDDQQWRSGVLREHIPTRLDRCDPWRPHQVVLWSLYELVRGVFRPWRLLTKLDLNGPLTPAILMLVSGTLWVYVLVAVVVGVATATYTGASPFASFVSGALYWAPLVVASGSLTGLFTFFWIVIVVPASLRMSAIGISSYIRLCCYWAPTIALFASLVVIACASTPWQGLIESAPAGCYGAAAMALLPAAVLHGTARERRASEQAEHGWSGKHRVGKGVRVLLSMLAFPLPAMLVSLILPTTLEPPLWVYF